MDKKTMRLDHVLEVQRLQLEGLSHSAIATALAMNRHVVVKYAAMGEAVYKAFLVKKNCRSKLFNAYYEPFVKERLTAHPAVSVTQLHDWLTGKGAP